MFDVPGSDVNKVIIDEHVVRGHEQAIYRRCNQSISNVDTTTAPSSESIDDQDNTPRKVASANGV